MIHIDFETYSEADLKKVGAFKYAEHPSTRILMVAVAEETGPVFLWDAYNGTGDAEALDLLRRAEGRVYAHNAQFEEAIANMRMWEDLGIEPYQQGQWFCTAAMCRRAGLPYSLSKAGAALGLPVDQAKDRRGMALIRKFSTPGKKGRILPEDDPDNWALFCEYCRQDVVAEREIHRRLKTFDFPKHGLVADTWALDKEINTRGMPIDLKATREAIRVVHAYEKALSERFRALTGLNPTQTAKVLEWARRRGYEADNLQGATIKEEADKDYSEDLKEALAIRRDLSFAATKKLTRMRDCACSDGRVRGTLLYYGAGTGRWSAKMIQSQNFKRPTIKDTGCVLRMLKEDNGDDIEMLWGNPMEAISSTIRHFIALPDGQIYDADYASIEARIVCWLAGQTDALTEYRAGIDRYKRMASVLR